jgi:hypothetical protein
MKSHVEGDESSPQYIPEVDERDHAGDDCHQQIDDPEQVPP